MTIEFFTGFEGCAATADIYSLIDSYSNGGQLRTPGYGNVGKACGYSNYGSWWVGKYCTAEKTKAAGFHSIGHITGTLLIFKGPEISIRFDSTLQIVTVYRSSTLLASTRLVFPSGWTHIEAEVFSNATVGTVKVKIDGKLIHDLSNVNTDGSDITEVRFSPGLGAATQNARLDNLYIADELQGELYSVLLKPTSDDSVEFIPSSGTDNYALLQSNDGDTSYVSSDVVGATDLYEYEQLAVGLKPKALNFLSVAKKEGTGLLEIKNVGKYDAVEYEIGDSFALNSSYPSSTGGALNQILATFLDGSELTRDKINNSKFGFKIIGEISS